MHEMSICEGILMALEDAAKREGFQRVEKVRLEIGRFAGVEVDALRFGFDVVMKNSLAAGAELEIIELPGKALCFDCGETVEIEHRLDPCPNCSSGKLTPAGGDEMRIKDLEVI